MASIVILLLLCTAVLGDVYIWNGGSMNFSDTNNWHGGLVPGAANTLPCSTSFGVGGKNIISQMDVSCFWSKLRSQSISYGVGNRLFISSTSRLRLAHSGSRVVFSNGNTCESNRTNYQWTGGAQPEQRNVCTQNFVLLIFQDFACHQNWIVQDSTTLPTTPPW